MFRLRMILPSMLRPRLLPETNPVFLRACFVLAVAFAWALLPAAQTAPGPEQKWYKGNLHTHTINSDGDSSPDAVARWYKEHRYNFLVLTDHNFVTQPEGLNSIFAAEDRFLLIPGEEVTSGFEGTPIHVNGFNLLHTVDPLVGGSVVDTIQKNVDAIRGAGGMPSLNHPSFRWAVTPGELRQVNNMKLFEVYNGHPTTNDAGGGGVQGLEEMWDSVLTAGREIYGIAVDDAHTFKVFAPGESNPGRGWVHVKARELSTSAVLAALEAGEFYSSTGVELEDVTRLPNGLRVHIKAGEGSDAKYTTEFIGQEGKLLEKSFDNPAEYQLRAQDKYVRAKVSSSNGESAWVQPVFTQ